MDSFGIGAALLSILIHARADGGVQDKVQVVVERRPAACVRSRTFTIGYRSVGEPRSPARVEAWAWLQGSPDRPVRVGTGSLPTGDLEVTLPDDGAWEIALAVVDGDGVAHPALDPRPAADAVVSCDTEPPAVELTTQVGPNGKTTWVDGHGLLRWRARDRRCNPADLRSRVEWSEDRGETWILAGDDLRGTVAAGENFLATGTTCRVRVTVRDLAGNEASASSDDFATEVSPSLSVSACVTGGPFSPGQTVVLEWGATAGRERVVEAAIDMRRSSGPWREIRQVSPGESRVPIELPPAAADVQFRVRVVDSRGFTSYSNVATALVADAVAAGALLEILPNAETHEAGQTVMIVWSMPGVSAREARLERSADGVAWVKEDVADRESFRYELPSTPGPCWLRVSCLDEKGDLRFTPSRTIAVSAPSVPSLGFAVDSESAPSTPGGAAVNVQWAGDVGRIRRMWVQVSEDGPWRDALEVNPSALKAQFTAPDDGGTYRVRLRGLDVLGREFHSERVARVRVPGNATTLRAGLRTPITAPGGVAEVEILSDVEALAGTRLRVVMRSSSEEVETPAILRGAAVRFVARVGRGRWWIRVVAVSDKERYRTAEMPMDVVEWPSGPAKAGLEIRTLRGGETCRGGSGQVVALAVSGGVEVADVDVEMSVDSGRTWAALAEESLKRLAVGAHVTLPQISTATCRLRATWRLNPDVSSSSASDFVVDSTPPAVEAEAKEETGAIRIIPRVGPVLSGIRALRLHVRREGSASWAPAGSFRPDEPVLFVPKLPGRHAFHLEVVSGVDLSNGAPADDTPPHASFLWTPWRGDADEVGVYLDVAASGRVKGGASVPIAWYGRGSAGARVDLYLCTASKTVAVAEGLPLCGETDWTAPAGGDSACRLRARIRDGGRESWAESAVFEVEGSPPIVEAVEVE